MKHRKVRSHQRADSRPQRDAGGSRKPRVAARPRRERSALRSSDPFLARERGKYDEPVPSREMILQTLNAQGVPVSDAELARLLGITDS